MKIAITGNCQVVPLKSVFAHYLSDAEVFELEIWRFKGEQFFEQAKKLTDCDIIFSQPIHSDYFRPFTINEMKALCSEHGIKLVFFHNLAFDGTLPDCRYLGKIGSRIKGAISDYPSSIIVKSYLEGHDEQKCLDRVRSGYDIDARAVWDKSVSEILSRELTVDVPFADEVVELTRHVDSFHYFNHPKPQMLHKYGKKILEHSLSLSIKEDSLVLDDDLAKYGSWPVYSWVAEALGLDYHVDAFMGSHYQPGRIELSDFISQSYKIYSTIPREDIV